MTLAEALNPNTPAARLEEISNLENKEISQAVATNPNTSPKVLLKLFRSYPYEVLKNSALDLIRLEIPNFLEQLLSENCLFLKDAEDLPSFILEATINHPDPKVHYPLFSNHNLPKYYLDKLLAKLAAPESSSIRSYVAEKKNTPIYLLEKLAEDENSDVRRSVAANENIPVYLLEKLVSDQNNYVRQSVAKNKNTPTHLLEKLSKDKNINVRNLVAANENTPSYLLERLAEDQKSDVRISVAVNKNTHIHLKEKLLEKLAEDLNSSTRYNLTLKENLPTDILEKLAKDRSPRICHSIAKHPKINSKIIKLLFENKQFKPEPDERQEIIEAIELEIKRLNWTEARAREYLNKKYNNSNISYIDNKKLLNFWQNLAAIESNNYPTSLQQDIFEPLEYLLI